MYTIFLKMMGLANDYLGMVEKADLRKPEPGETYVSEGVTVSGVTNKGKKYRLELILEDKAE